MPAKHLGFIGLGRMGGPMAGRLLDAGYSLTVFDTNDAAMQPLADRGAAIASSPAEVASQAAIVLMSLPVPSVVKAVALGENGIIAGDRVEAVIDLSTTGPAIATAAATGLAERGVTWVDAPVSGGVVGGRSGTLAVRVSCPKGTLETIEPVLKVFGRTFFTGEKPGLAQVVKLANNLLAAAA